VSLSTTKSGESTPMIAVRSAGYSFDSIIGYQDEHGRNVPLVDEKYLQVLVAIANDRFRINVERIARFRTALIDAFKPSGFSTSEATKPDWEDTNARRQRKREEGLARQQALRTTEIESKEIAQEGTVDFDGTSYIDHIHR
jgi:tRNA wybutosine-synthesizing protein 3